jgi:plastocyanin
LTRIRELKRARYLAPLAALALVGGTMVACGGGDDDGDDPTATATTAASSPAATTTTAAAQPTATATQPAATATTQAAGVTIQVADILFAPDDETVPVGTEVTWRWAGELPHSVVGEFNGQEVKSEQQTSGTFRFTFASAGTFEYECGVHGKAMTGRIVVQ